MPTPLIDEFCDALWLEDGLARNTLDAYRRDLAQYAQWLAKHHYKDLPAADHGDVQAYLAHQFRRQTRASSAAPACSLRHSASCRRSCNCCTACAACHPRATTPGNGGC